MTVTQILEQPTPIEAGQSPAERSEPLPERDSGIVYPPSDLYSDEPEMETYFHLRQMLELLQCLEWWWGDRQDYFAAGNLTVYYSPRQKKSEYFRGPDFFVVLNTDRKPRKSWVVWEENGQYPHVIVELLSDSTEETDRGEKKQIYQDIFRTPEYFWFHPVTKEFQGFILLGGHYEEIQPNGQGWRWSEQLQLFLGVHDGDLRFFTPEEQLVPTPEESARSERQEKLAAQQQAELAQQQAEASQQQAELAQQQAEASQQQVEIERQQAIAAQQQREILAAKLRELGVDPETL